MRHILLISGKDSLATAVVQVERAPHLPYELVHNDTGWDLPETLEWIERVGAHFGRPVLRLGDDLTEICNENNCLPLPWRRFCTKYAKIKPLNDYLGRSPATVYFGLRADEPERIGYVVPPKQPLTPAYPLRELGLALPDVWRLCERVGLLPPQFRWAWMEARVRELLGPDGFLLDRLPPWERNSLLAWRSRSNCDRCFYARLYEKVGLYEHHPDRFEDACVLEERLCHRDEFTWAKGYRLRDLIPRADRIKEARARAVVGYLRDGQQQTLFDAEGGPDELAVTSCGLLCGK
jgi:hypothetical protein